MAHFIIYFVLILTLQVLGSITFCQALENQIKRCPYKLSSDQPAFLQDPSCNQTEFCTKAIHEDAIFDTELKKCILPIRYSRRGSFPIECWLINEKTTSCPLNSSCQWEGMCSCDPMFNLVGFNKCVRGKVFGEACDSTAEESCYGNAGLECRHGECKCSQEDKIWNNASLCINPDCKLRKVDDLYSITRSLKCKLRVDGRPTRKKDLDDNLATCPENADFDRRDDTYTTCKCNEGYSASKDRSVCLLEMNYGQTCDLEGNVPCSNKTGLYCGDDLVCKCVPDSKYNPTDNLCYSQRTCSTRSWTYVVNDDLTACSIKMGSPCNPNITTGIICMENSSCVEDKYGGYSKHVCQCNPGFRSSQYGCMKIKMMDEDCEASREDPCYADAKLTCLPETGKCGCKEGRIWDRFKASCAIKAGEECQGGLIISDCQTNSKCDVNEYCPLRCPAYCRCIDGYETINGKCIGSYMSQCEVDEDCSVGLTCIDGLCKCPKVDQQYFERGLGKCVNLFGSTCDRSGRDDCSQNSICGDDGVCRCEIGFKENSNGHCRKMLDNGESCKPGGCDASKGLACISMKCSCLKPSLKYEEGKGCMASEGQTCGDVDTVGTCSKDVSNPCEYYKINCQPSFQCGTNGHGISKCLQKSTAPSAEGAQQ